MAEQRGSGGARRVPRHGGQFNSDVKIDLGFGDLFKGLGNLLDLLNQMAEEGKSEVTHGGEVHGSSGVRGVYGFSVKMGMGGKPTVEGFGNVHSTEQGPQVSDVREPLVDVFDEGDHILVVAELPGVVEGDILVEARDDILTLSATGRERKYAKEVLLPTMIDPVSLQQSYQNGILEIRLGKTQPFDQ
ncbi:MAG: Hsp20/alpha crystallin family protein [Chloroflexota bacterium]|nr:MAG: Hsp20/alpha crystallin family protein [Chloroflexota bacterium]